MKKTWLLIKVQLLSIFDVKKIFHFKGNDNMGQSVYALLGLACALLFGAFSGFYSYSLAISFKMFGALNIMPAALMAITSIISLVTSIYKANGILFHFSDYDTLMALPVSTQKIVTSRIMLIYLYNIFFAALIMLPGSIVYGVMANSSPGFYIMTVFLIIFLPLVPLTIATAIGLVLYIISARSKYASLVNLLLMLFLFAGVMILNFQMSFTLDGGQQFTGMSKNLLDMFYNAYPLTNAYANAVISLDLASIFLFIGASVAVFSMYCFIISKFFKKINSYIAAITVKSNFHMRSLQQSSVMKALFTKEVKRYFSSSIYVLNTATGSLMMTILTVFLAVAGRDKITRIIEIPQIADSIKWYVPIVISFCMSLTSTTAPSISIEGKNFWILKTLPVSPITIFKSKIMVNLLVTIPLIFINAIVLGFILKMNPYQVLISIWMPVTYSFFISIIGLTAGLRYPNFEWKSEVAVIKQGLPVLITLLSGMASIVVPIVLLNVVKNINPYYIYLATSVFIILLTGIAYRNLKVNGSKTFSSIG